MMQVPTRSGSHAGGVRCQAPALHYSTVFRGHILWASRWAWCCLLCSYSVLHVEDRCPVWSDNTLRASGPVPTHPIDKTAPP